MAVFTLTSLSTTVRRASATPILSSLSKNDNNNNTSPSPSPRSPVDKLRPINTVTPPQPPPIRSKPLKQRKPSVSQIERAIGAGDSGTTNRDSRLNKTLFDAVLSNSIGRTEGNVEKKLRETGEWLLDRTEGSSSSSPAGKNILKVVFQLILPMWILAFLVASGVLKLPFSAPFIDDLIM